jgi:homocitrate synthase NifV
LINIYLNQLGIFQSEFGFPTTRHETLYLQANLELAEMGVLKPIRLAGWIRAVREDVELTYRLVPGLRYLNLSISTSDQMITNKLRSKTRNNIIEDMVEAVEAARAHGAQSIGVNAEDASRSDLDYLIKFGLAAKEHGAQRLRYCDTLGYDNPFTVYETVKKLAENTGMDIEIHCHGDLGMAVANSLAGARGAVDAGKDVYINTTINGIGERAGNADLVACILAVTKSKAFAEKYELGNCIDLSRAWKMAKFASYAFDVPIPINQPGVGANAFAHASGIHADGVIKDPENYELYGYGELGRGEPQFVETGREIIAGQYSGISGFRHVMGKMEVKFRDDEEAREVLELARYANVESHKPLVEEELLFIARYPKIAKKLLTLTPLE